MNHSLKFKQLAVAISKSILKTDFHPIFYFAMVFLGLAQTFLCFLKPQFLIFNVFKWFDLSLYADSKVLFYILLAPCLICAFSVIIQIIWAFSDTSMHTKIPQHYFIKITMAIGFFMSHALCLTIIRCSVTMIESHLGTGQALGVLMLLFYLLIIYPYTMFFITDLSPQNNKIYSVCAFCNSLTLFHLYKPIAALITSSHKYQYVMIPTGIFFVLLAISLVKLPILTWQYNKLSQSLISWLMWMILCRFVQIFSAQQLTAFVWMPGVPIFVFFFQWVLNRRVYSILQIKTNTVLKLKIIYFLVVNKTNYKEELSLFLVSHYKGCYREECRCHSILKIKQPELLHQSSKSDGASKYRFADKSSWGTKAKAEQIKDAVKTVQETRNQNQHQDAQMVVWYQFLVDLQKEILISPQSDKFPTQAKEDKIKKGRQIFLDSVQILHYLDKQYQSLICLWQNEGLYLDGVCSLFLLVRYTIQIFKQEETLQRKSKHNFFIQSALKYYQQQNQLTHFKKILNRAAKAMLRFWVELFCEISDQKRILQYLRDFVEIRQDIFVERNKMQAFAQNKTQEGEQQKRKWSFESRMPFDQAYRQFKEALMLSNQIYQARQIQNVKKHLASNHESSLQKNLRIFNFKQKTGIATVNLQEGAEFGSISMTNQYFWQLMEREKYQNAQVNHFLMEQLHWSHKQKMVNFLQQNKPSFSFHQIFVPVTDHLIIQLEASLHLLPHLKEGFFSVIYFQEASSEKSLLVFNRSSNVLGYNSKFKRNFLKHSEIEDYEKAFSKQFYCKLSDARFASLVLVDQQFELKLRRIINHQDNIKENILYYCEVVSDPLDNFDSMEFTQKTMGLLLKGKDSEGSTYKGSENSKLEKIRSKQAQKKTIDKGKRIQEIEETEQVKQIFDLLTNEKKSKNIKKWYNFVLAMLIVGTILTLISGSLSTVKYNAYTAASKIFGQLTFFTQTTARAAYLTRKVNVVSFNKAGELEVVVQNLYSLNNTLTNGKRALGINQWNQLVTSYNTEIGGQIIQDQISFDVTIQVNLLAPFTSYLQQSQGWGFDLISDSTTAQPIWQLSYSNMIMNCYYTILPTLHSKFRLFIEDKYKKPIVLPVPLIPILMFVIALAISIQVVTIYLHIKIHTSVYSSLSILTHLRRPFIKQRIESLRSYIGKGFERVEDKTEVMGSFNMKAQNSNMLHQITTRNLELQNETSREGQNEGKRKIELKVSRINKKAPILFIVLGILPMMLIPASVVGYQAGQNAYIWGKLQLISLHNSLIENILFVNSYSYEFAYENNYFKAQSISMSAKLATILEDTYSLSHKIEAAEAKQNTDYRFFVFKTNSLPICDILQLACNGYDCQKCDDTLHSFYQQKSRNEVLVLFVETARALLANYRTPNMTREIKQNFMLDPRHKELQQISEHLISVENYKMKSIMANYANSLKYYQFGIIFLCVLVVPVAILIQICWTGRKQKQMEEEANISKAIVEMVTYKETVDNPSISKHFTDNIQRYSIIL